MPVFFGTNVLLLRQFRGWSQPELAERVQVSQATVHTMERGREPGSEIVDALATAFAVDRRFFYAHVEDVFTESDCNFRKGVQSIERIRHRVLAQGTLFGHLIHHLRSVHRLTFSPYNVPDITATSETSALQVELAAETCREHWSLGFDTPIQYMNRVLETKGGVMLARLRDDETARLDAFSRRGREGGTSFVVLNPAKGSASRTRFDLAHELAHLVLHSRHDPNLDLKTREAQADLFAAAFLLPREAFRGSYWNGRGVNWHHVYEMKRVWKVSIQAIIYRARHLGLIDAVEFRRAYKKISAEGWLKGEPLEPEPEGPELFRKVMATLFQRRRIGVPEVAQSVGWSVQTFEDVTGLRAAESLHTASTPLTVMRERPSRVNSTIDAGASSAARKGANVHVSPSQTKPGKSVVREAGNSKLLSLPVNQTQSAEKAISIAKQHHGKLRVHGRSGHIRDSDK